MPYSYAEKKRSVQSGKMNAVCNPCGVGKIPNSVKINENPAAEREADRISSGIPASLTPDQLKSALSQRMGADFSGVRFHTGAQAEQSATAIGARAYAQGRDVYFGKGGFDSQIAAHELVHTVQQGSVSGEGTMSMPTGEIQMWPWSKKKAQIAAPVSTPAAATASPAVPKKSFLEKAKEKAGSAKDWIADKASKAGNAITGGAVSAFDAVRNAQDDFHEWRKGVKDKISNAYEGSALQKGVNSVKGKLSDAGAWIKGKAKAAGGWVKDKATSAANYVKDSAFGKAVGSAATAVKDKAKAVGGWVKDKATTAADYVKNSAVGKAVGSAATAVKDKAIAAGNAVKNSKFGQAVGTAGRWVKDKAVSAANYVGEKYGAARKWVNEKKDSISEWFEDKAEAVRQHDEARYLEHRKKKIGDFETNLDEAEADMLADPEISKNLRMRDDVDRLMQYDDESRDYGQGNGQGSASAPFNQNQGLLSKEGSKGWKNLDKDGRAALETTSGIVDDGIEYYNTAKMAKGLLNPKFDSNGEFDYGEFNLEDQGAWGKGLSTGMDIVNSYVSGRSALENVSEGINSAKAGNKQNMAMQFGDAASDVMDIAGNFVDNTPFDIAQGAFDFAKNGMNLGIHTKQKHDVNALSQADLQKEIQDQREQKMMADAQHSISDKLSVDQVDDVGNMIQGAVKVAGGAADVMGASGLGTAAATVANVPIKLATAAITSHMKSKNDKYAAQRDIFGSREKYKDFKHKHHLRKKDMELLMKKHTHARTMQDIADRARTEQAQVIHKNLAKQSAQGADIDTGADMLMSKLGFSKKAGRKDLKSKNIKKYTGAEMALESLKRRKRA